MTTMPFVGLKHPAVLLPFDKLLADLEAHVDTGHVSRRQSLEDPHLFTYCYSQSCVVNHEWNETTILARGIVLDHKAKKVLALPFPKFFNYGEVSHSVPSCGFVSDEKLDGSLGIVFHDGERWRCATKGSLNSDQAQWATARLPKEGLERGNTYLFEIIYKTNRIVVSYDFEGLVLLGAYRKDGTEFSPEECDEAAEIMEVRRPQRDTFESLEEMLQKVAGFGADREGYVVRFANGMRLKVKGAEYLRVHRLVSRVTPLGVWDLLISGDNAQSVLQQLPDEFHEDFKQIHAVLTKQYKDVIEKVTEACQKTAGMTDKEVGLSADTLDPVVRRFIFRARRSPDWFLDKKFNESLWRMLRPTGNILKDYTASMLITRVTNPE